ncbi:MAG TPA: carboxypeptidase regulatory-like domain-containing protein [Thermoanaerobaculia bacterium]|nr:carboxypeptidase regulatory-like domain-containing protein [Thermoanaerobaculia bacterium]
MRLARTVVALLLSLLALPSLAAITGTVMTRDGQPVAGVRVFIHSTETVAQRRERLLSASPLLVALAETKTDAKGAFSLPSPKEPVVDLRLEMRGFEPESRRVEKDEDAGTITVVTREPKSGTISAGGKPVANATVVVNYGGAEWTVRTDAQGKYEVPDQRRVSSITVLHPDFAIDDENFFNMAGSSVPVSKLTRTLTAGTPITGKVVLPDGKSPVAKAVIAIDGWPVATSADDGSFVIAHGPAKWTMLTARKDTLLGQQAFAAGKPLTVRTERVGTVSGRVLDARTKAPVPGAMVRVNPLRRGMGFIDTSSMALTDARGTFSIPAGPGSYMMFVTHPGYDQQNGDVLVNPGQTTTRDFNVTQLARVSGVVVDSERRPVNGAKVSSEAASEEMGMPSMIFMSNVGTTTGADGRFALRLKGDSDLRLRAARKGLPQTKSDAMKLQPGERKSGIVLTIPSGVAVTGRVVDASGQPLSGVSVVATDTPAGNDRMMFVRRMVMFGGPNQDDEDVVRTASDGTFTMRLKEGTYDFAFKREGFAPKAVRAQSVTANGTQPIEAKLDVASEITGRVTRGGVGISDVMVNAFAETTSSAMTGPDGSFTLSGLSAGSTRVSFRKEDALINEQRTFTAPVRDVNVELPLGGTIRGRVVEKDSTKPITSFQAGVAASRSGGGMMMMAPPLLKSFTSDDGSFVLENVPSGAMNLIANANGYSAARLNVDVEEGKTLNDVVLELEQGTRLTGRVTGSNGSGLADVTVAVQPSATGTFAMTGSLRRATTDANGEYTLDGLNPGEETIQFSHAKYSGVSKTVMLKGKDNKLDVTLEGGSTITGVVVTDTGAPVADAEVGAFSAGAGGRSARTNASGTFELEGLRPGRYRFTASKSGYVEASQSDVDISASTPIRLVLQSGGTIYGRVTGVSEADMANASVSARGARGAASSAPVDPQGNYRIEGAPTGTVSVSASVQPRDFGSRRSSGTQTVEVAAGSSQQVNIDFRGDVVVKGRVIRNGQALPGANISFYPRRSGSQASAAANTDEQGMYSVAGLEEGEYNVTVTDIQRFSPYNTTYTVRGSGTFDIDFKAASVRGRVIDAATNEPVDNASVQFRATAAGVDFRGVRAAMTDSAGAFSIDFVNPGSYQITASRDGYGNVTEDVTLGESGSENIELKLSRNDGVALNIVDGRDGRALSGMVTVFDAQGRIAYDTRGIMRFGDSSAHETRLPIAPGSYTATVMVPEYAPRSISITSPSKPTISMTPGGTILVRSRHNQRKRMRLLDSSGMWYPRWSATPIPRDLPPGTATLEHIAPGSYTLVLLNDDDSAAGTQSVSVREGETVTVDL